MLLMLVILPPIYDCIVYLLGHSMSNRSIFLDVDTVTSQILLIFSLFVDNVEMINPWKVQPSTPYGSKVIEI